MPPTKRETRIAPPPENGQGPHLVWPNASSTAERCADLDVGLVYTYERAYLDTLLPQLSRSGDAIRLRLILVDNASTDGVQAWQNVFPAQATVRNSARLGYAANLNRILEASSAPYALLLNSDMEFDPSEQCLTRMVRFMDEHPRCGLSTCGVYHRDGAYAYPARRWQTPRIVLARRLRLFSQGRRVVDEYLYRDRAATETFPCDWVSGCFMLVRRAAIAEVGPFDTRFGKYFEDVDMCRRMHRAGWNVMHHGATRCVHFEQRASRRLFSRDAARHAAAYVRWLWKWRRG